MANKEIETRADYFGTANGTEAEMEQLYWVFDEPENINKSWDYVDKKMRTGDIPYLEPGQYDKSDIYDAGAADGCPVTDRLLDIENLDPTMLINLYLARNGMHRMIAGLLKEAGNSKLLEKWQGNEDRKPGEERVDYAIEGTPTKIIEKGNPHVGVAKYENFAICQLFRRLKDAERGIEGPVKNLPTGVKLYPSIDDFREDAKKADSLNDLNERFVLKLLPIMIAKGVTIEQAKNLLLDCFLAEPLLIEDNCWDRASKATNELASKLIQSDNEDLQQIGSILKEEIEPKIFALKK